MPRGMPITQRRRPGTPPKSVQYKWTPEKQRTSRSRIKRKWESILRQLRHEGRLLEDTEDIISDGRVEEKEENNESGGETTDCFSFIAVIDGAPHKEADSSQEEWQ